LTVTVAYSATDGTATSPGDYTAVAGSLTFAPGATALTFTVAIADDALDEGNETVVLALGSPANATLGAPNAAVLTIVDNDPMPVVSFSAGAYSVGEGDGPAVITVTLSAVSGRAVTVSYATTDGTAAAPGDYGSASGVLTFTAGMTVQTFTVGIVDDGLNEGDEGLNLTLSGAVNATIGGTNPVTLTIVDNDVVGALIITKLAVDLNGTPLRVGDRIEYRIEVTNGDASTHTNVLIGDWVPQNTALVAGSEACSPGATCIAYLDAAPGDAPAFGADDHPADSGGLVMASVGSLAPGAVLTLTFQVWVPPGVSSIGGNIAMTESDGQEMLATDPVCPPAGCVVVAGLVATGVAADINGAPLVAGEVVEYRIVVTNNGGTVSNVSITDTVPTNMALVAGSITCSAGASCGEAGGEIVASIGSLGSGGAITLTFRARVDPCVTSVGGNVAAFWSDDQGRQETLPVYPPGGGAVLACPADLYEGDDSPAQAVHLQVGKAYSQFHTFCDDSADWNAFTALANEVYTITTSSWGLNADTFLTIIGTDGVTVWAINDDCPGATDGSSCIVWTAPSSGVYYARTTNRGGLSGCNTEYEVWIESRTPPVLVYLPLVARNYAPADLSMDVPPGVGEAGRASRETRIRARLETAPSAVGEASWLGSGSLLFALLGVRKVRNVRRKR
jgi:uncharacterized repeat protein (TIGR01451 family)